MAKTSETGHARNEANFAQLITICQSFGPLYAPASASLTIPKLEDKRKDVGDAMDLVTSTDTALQVQRNFRKEIFEEMQSRATRFYNSFKAGGASKQALDDQKTYLRKLRGARAGKVKTLPDGTEAPSNSVSQRSFDYQAEHFESMIAVAAQNGYTANDPGLKLADLQTLLGEARTATLNVNTAEAAYASAIINRDKQLYAPKTGAIHLAQDVKDYVKGIFGPRSPQARQLTALRFHDRSGK